MPNFLKDFEAEAKKEAGCPGLPVRQMKFIIPQEVFLMFSRETVITLL